MESCSDQDATKRYLSLNDEDRNGLLDSAIPKNTKNATKHWMKVLNNYLKDKKDCKQCRRNIRC